MFNKIRYWKRREKGLRGQVEITPKSDKVLKPGIGINRAMRRRGSKK